MIGINANLNQRAGVRLESARRGRDITKETCWLIGQRLGTLAEALVKGSPVMRADIALARGPRSFDRYRRTLSRGSSVYPICEGLTLKAHGYVEWRTPFLFRLNLVVEKHAGSR